MVAVGTLILLWTVEEGPTAVSQGTNTFTHTWETWRDKKKGYYWITELKIFNWSYRRMFRSLNALHFSYHQVLPAGSVQPHFLPGWHTIHTEAWQCTGNTGWAGSTGECKSRPQRVDDHIAPLHIAGAGMMGSCTGVRVKRLAVSEHLKKHISDKTSSEEGQSYLLQSHAPHAVLPASIRASGAQTQTAVMKTMAGRWAGHRWRRLHLHGWDI